MPFDIAAFEKMFPNVMAMERQLQAQQRGQFQGQGFNFSSAPSGTAGGAGRPVIGGRTYGTDLTDQLANIKGLGEYLPGLQQLILAGGALYDAFTESPREKLEKEILQARRERLTDLRRHAKGDFSESERAQVMRAYAPVHERVATNLAMRGIEGSGAAGQILAEAEQAPFLQLQQQAQVQLDQYELDTFKLAYELAGEDNNFMTDLSRGFRASAQRRALGSADATEGQFNQLMTQLNETAAEYEAIIEEFQEFASDLEGQ